MQEDEKLEEYIREIDIDVEKQGWKSRCTNFLEGKFFIPVIIILVAIIAFSLGRLSKLSDEKVPVRVLNNSSPNPSLNLREGSSAPSESLQNAAAAGVSSGVVVGSKNSDKYHYPWCSGAQRISPQNLISFDSIEAARAQGYTPAANCPGLK